jgi:hypothetical protein
MNKVKVVQREGEPPIELEIIAQDIAKLAQVGRNIAASRLKQKTILILLSHFTGLGQHNIKTILDALPQLEKTYLK